MKNKDRVTLEETPSTLWLERCALLFLSHATVATSDSSIAIVSVNNPRIMHDA